MRVRSLEKIFNPRRVAVIGASRRPGSFGYTVLRNLISAGFGGVVYPVNPKREAIHGIMAYRDVASLPHPPDLAVVSVRADLVPGIVHECGESGVGGLIILSAGFGEVGETGLALEEQVRQAMRPYPDMRIIGPNCLGIMVPEIGLNATLANAIPNPGGIAFISQSGPLCASMLDWAIHQDIGFSHFVSVGNALDVTIGDLIDYSGQDERTESILLYVESISDARKFMSASRAFARTKPIVAYKAGRFPESQKAAAAHTGAMAGDDAIYNAAFARAGIIRVDDVNDMFECAELLGRRLVPRGPRLAILTNAGGPGVMATDALIARGGALAPLSEETISKLDARLPELWSHGNPVDLLVDASPQRYREATEIVLADPGVDAALVILTPHVPDATAPAIEVAEASRRTNKPVLAAWMGADAVAEGTRVLSHAGVPTYSSPQRAVNAFMCLVSYARHIELLYEMPREVPVAFDLDHERLRQECRKIVNGRKQVLSEFAAKTLLDAYGIPTAQRAERPSQDRRRRRGPGPEGRRTGGRGVPAADRDGGPQASGGGHRGGDGPADVQHGRRLRDDPRRQERSHLRIADHGRRRRCRRRGHRRPRPWPAPAQRAACPADARGMPLLADPGGLPRAARAERRPARRDPHTAVLPGCRPPRDR
jgi:acetyltransferase